MQHLHCKAINFLLWHFKVRTSVGVIGNYAPQCVLQHIIALFAPSLMLPPQAMWHVYVAQGHFSGKTGLPSSLNAAALSQAATTKN